MEAKIAMQSIYILIDLGSTHSYITSRIFEKWYLRKIKHDESWLVQLATTTKRKVSEVVKEWLIETNGFPNTTKLNNFPLGSYDIIIKMDWMERHRSKVNFYNKIVEWHDDDERPIEIKGVPQPISLNNISSLHLRKLCWVNCHWCQQGTCNGH